MELTLTITPDHTFRGDARADVGAFQIEIEDFVPALFGQFEEAQALDERAGVVDEDVERAEVADGGVEKGMAFGGIADVGAQGDRGAAGGFDRGDGFVRAFFIPEIIDGDFCAGCGEKNCRGGADSGRGAGD
jgi:hypothetical protein